MLLRSMILNNLFVEQEGKGISNPCIRTHVKIDPDSAFLNLYMFIKMNNKKIN
jgi:hypothetical protein